MKAIMNYARFVRENYTYIIITTLFIAIVVGFFTPTPGIFIRQYNILLIVIMIAAMSFTITFSNLGMAARDWKGTLLGKVLGQGALTAARVLGVRRVSSVKGQGMPAYDPRAIKGNGVTYATSPMGADHTAGNVIPGRTGFHFDNKRTDMDVTDQGGKLKLSRDLQIMTTVCDSLGFCFFVGATLPNMEVFAKLINARFGIDFTAIDLLEMGLATIKREILFNERAGISFAANDLPEFFRIEKLPPKGYGFEIEKEGLVTLFS